jgi:hypothetical protein
MYWIHESEFIRSEYGDTVQKHPDPKPVIKQADKVDTVFGKEYAMNVGAGEDRQRVINKA